MLYNLSGNQAHRIQYDERNRMFFQEQIQLFLDNGGTLEQASCWQTFMQDIDLEKSVVNDWSEAEARLAFTFHEVVQEMRSAQP